MFLEFGIDLRYKLNYENYIFFITRYNLTKEYKIKISYLKSTVIMKFKGNRTMLV